MDELEIIKRGVVSITTEELLIGKLKKSKSEKKPLRIKLGVDPTAPDIHLGFTVVLRKLRQFQELGHRIVLIIGDYTAMIGDPSGRSAARPQLTHEQVMENSKKYQQQFFKIVGKENVEIVYNGSWFSKMNFQDIIKLVSKVTIGRLLSHDYFADRYKAGNPISLHELMYPVMQGYDSIMVQADIELGATDQTFNVLIGRDMQKDAGMEPQIGIFMPVLIGMDGKQKMSKSLGNYIGIDEEPQEIFGKLMSIPDEIMIQYYELISDLSLTEINEIKKQLKDGSFHPRDAKKKLAYEITRMYSTSEKAKNAEEEFERVFKDKQNPEDMQEIKIASTELKDGKIWIVKLLTLTGMAESKGEAQRLISQGAVTLNGEKITTPSDCVLQDGAILKVGKRKFAKLRL
ncbi:MAG: tyrosine--tRNA ligase [Candidatus Firestonebacteria bacterium]|mgnify:CR=1 FL=1